MHDPGPPPRPRASRTQSAQPPPAPQVKPIEDRRTLWQRLTSMRSVPAQPRYSQPQPQPAPAAPYTTYKNWPPAHDVGPAKPTSATPAARAPRPQPQPQSQPQPQMQPATPVTAAHLYRVVVGATGRLAQKVSVETLPDPT